MSALVIDVIPGSPEWLLARIQYLTASETAAACNLSRYISRNDLLKHKRQGKDAPRIEPNQAMIDGLAWEPIITERVCNILECKSEEVKMYRSKKVDYISCTPDRRLVFSDGRVRYVELKLKTREDISMTTFAPDIEHLIQVYMQMFVMCQVEIYLAYSTKEQLKVIFLIKREQWFLAFLLDQAQLFREHWIDEECIPIESSNDTVYTWTADKILKSFQKIQRINCIKDWKLVIVGSRTLKNTYYPTFVTEVERYIFEIQLGLPSGIVSGGATGADQYAERWAKTKHIEMIVLKPKWNTSENAAIIAKRRNSDIINYPGVTHVLAFHHDHSRGTQDSVEKGIDKLGRSNVRVITITTTPTHHS